MKKTYLAKVGEVQKKWWIVDATDQVLGRLSSKVASVLRGKHKVQFTPHADCGDHVIVINADKIVLTGRKWETKIHYRTSGRPGGLKAEPYKQLRHTRPERIVTYAIKGMLPKTKLGDKMYGHLMVYKGEAHPHSGQKPQPLKV